MIKKIFTEKLAGRKHLGLTLLCALLFLAIALSNLPAILSVSSKVGDRELPIYCVQTDKKQIALSFDAAWGDTSLRHKKIKGNSLDSATFHTRIH